MNEVYKAKLLLEIYHKMKSSNDFNYILKLKKLQYLVNNSSPINRN